MNTDRVINGWTIIAVFLALVIIVGGIVIGLKYSRGGPIEISLAPASTPNGQIYIGGEVNNPGYYPRYDDDSVAGLIAAAGGITGDAESSSLELIISGNEGEASPQLININTAEAWLLESLPGIGVVRARTIVEYRQQNGPFPNIQAITKVEGIGTTSFEQISHLITVAE